LTLSANNDKLLGTLFHKYLSTEITTCVSYFCSPRFYLGFCKCQFWRLGYKVLSILDL